MESRESVVLPPCSLQLVRFSSPLAPGLSLIPNQSIANHFDPLNVELFFSPYITEYRIPRPENSSDLCFVTCVYRQLWLDVPCLAVIDLGVHNIPLHSLTGLPSYMNEKLEKKAKKKKKGTKKREPSTTKAKDAGNFVRDSKEATNYFPFRSSPNYHLDDGAEVAVFLVLLS